MVRKSSPILGASAVGTSSSVAALIFVGPILITLGVLAGSLALMGMGSVLLLAAGLFQTLQARSGPLR
jgi:hypothetical protein